MSAASTLRKRVSIVMAVFIMRAFFSTRLPSIMPGATLCARRKAAFISPMTSEQSSRQLFMRPGLRFCGMAEET